MKKNLKVYISAVLAIILVAGMIIFPPQSLACGGDGLTSEGGDLTNCEDTPSEAQPLVSEPEESSEGDEYYFGSATTVNSEVDVDHSLFLAGNEVASKDEVYGIGFLAGNLVNAAGTYDYGLFAGNSVEITGEVNNDLFVAGNTIKIDESALVSRDVYAAGNILTISANLNGNVFAVGNRLVLDSVTIDGDLDAAFDSIVVLGKSSISGTFKYNEDAVVSGLENLSFAEKEVYASPSVKTSFATKLLNKLISVLGTLALTFVLIAVFNKFALKLLKNFRGKEVFKNTLVGLGILIFVPTVAIFVMLTIVGLPLGLVALALWLLSAIFAESVSGLVLGDLLAKEVFKKEKMSLYLKVTIGIVLLELLSFVPILGLLVGMMSLFFGIGYLFVNLLPKKS